MMRVWELRCQVDAQISLLGLREKGWLPGIGRWRRVSQAVTQVRPEKSYAVEILVDDAIFELAYEHLDQESSNKFVGLFVISLHHKTSHCSDRTGQSLLVCTFGVAFEFW
jgi:hypothetical protein